MATHFCFTMAIPVYYSAKMHCSVIGPHIWESNSAPRLHMMEKLELEARSPKGPYKL